MTVIDGNGAAHDVADGRFTHRRRSSAAGSLDDVPDNSIAFPSEALMGGDAARILEFCFEHALVSDRVRQNMRVAYARHRHDSARRQAKRWVDDVWLKSDKALELIEEQRNGQLSGDVFISRALDEEAWHVREVERSMPVVIPLSKADAVVRAARAVSFIGRSPEAEQAKVLGHVIEFPNGESETIAEITQRFRTDAYWLRAMTDSDLGVVDALERSQRLQIDEHAAEIERRLLDIADKYGD